MVIAVAPEVTAALADREGVDRDFIWFTVRDRGTGADYSEGYWADTGTISQTVTDPETGASGARTWYGSGQLIRVGPIPRVLNLTVIRVPIHVSGIDDRIEDLLRTYDPKQGKVQIYRGVYDPATRAILSPPFPRFWGWIDDVRMPTPEEGGSGEVVLDCVGTTQELARANPALRSDSDQRLRSATDTGLLHAATAHTWIIHWGRRPARVGTRTPDGGGGRTGPSIVDDRGGGAN